MTLGKYIKHRRIELGMRQGDVAARLLAPSTGRTINSSYLCEIEKGTRRPTSHYLLAQLSISLAVPFDYICFLAGVLPSEAVARYSNARPEAVERAFTAFRDVLEAE